MNKIVAPNAAFSILEIVICVDYLLILFCPINKSEFPIAMCVNTQAKL